MYAITGITGRVGGVAAEALLAAGHQVRAVARDASKVQKFQDIAIAEVSDTEALTQAFQGVQAVFIMIPPNWAPSPGYPETRAVIASLKSALQAAKVPKVVALSSIGAQRDRGLGLIAQLHIMEQEFQDLDADVAFIRAGWFMENAQFDVAIAKEKGEFETCLSPLDHPFPMIATRDIGEWVARTLTEAWSGKRVIELEGPARYSPVENARI